MSWVYPLEQLRLSDRVYIIACGTQLSLGLIARQLVKAGPIYTASS